MAVFDVKVTFLYWDAQLLSG